MYSTIVLFQVGVHYYCTIYGTFTVLLYCFKYACAVLVYYCRYMYSVTVLIQVPESKTKEREDLT